MIITVRLNMINVNKILVIIGLFFFSSTASATCLFTSDDSPMTPQDIDIQAPSNVYIGVDFISDVVSAKSGDPQVSQQIPVLLEEGYCTKNWTARLVSSQFSLTGGENPGLNTNVKSVRINMDVGSTGIGGFNFVTPSGIRRPSNAVMLNAITFTLKKTSKVERGTGTINGGEIAQVIIDEEGGDSYVYARINLNPITVNAGSCTVSSGETVRLGTHSLSTFTAVGSESAGKDFNISVTCDPELKVYGKFEGSDTNPVTDGVFALTDKEGSATGIGIQIEFQGRKNPPILPKSIIKNGVDTLFINGTIQDNGTYFIDFKAKYYQFSPTVTTGVADGSVTYTITYD